jgi:carbamoyl-phosphate synthase large subunit
MIKNGDISLIVNTIEDKRGVHDSYAMRNAALQNKITYYTTLAGARAACAGIRHVKELQVYSLQSLHTRLQ